MPGWSDLAEGSTGDRMTQAMPIVDDGLDPDALAVHTVWITTHDAISNDLNSGHRPIHANTFTTAFAMSHLDRHTGSGFPRGSDDF